MKENTIAVIPARGGSKRIPKKNIRLLCGKPMIAYTIEAAVQSQLFFNVIVSTDDKEIADIAIKYGAYVPYLRNPELSDDFTPVSLVTLDVLTHIESEGKTIQHIAQLLPNCPLRNSDDIIQSYNEFRINDARSQISVSRYGWLNPWWAMIRNERNVLSPIFPEQMGKRSQDLPDLFCPTGATWWIKADVLKQERTYHCAGRTGWEMPWDHAVDIDTEDDWKMAELLMRERLL